MSVSSTEHRRVSSLCLCPALPCPALPACLLLAQPAVAVAVAVVVHPPPLHCRHQCGLVVQRHTPTRSSNCSPPPLLVAAAASYAAAAAFRPTAWPRQRPCPSSQTPPSRANCRHPATCASSPWLLFVLDLSLPRVRPSFPAPTSTHISEIFACGRPIHLATSPPNRSKRLSALQPHSIPAFSRRPTFRARAWKHPALSLSRRHFTRVAH